MDITRKARREAQEANLRYISRQQSLPEWEQVEDKLTQLGVSLGAAFCGVWVWAAENLKHVEQARREFDNRAD